MTERDKQEIAQARREKNKATLAKLKQQYPAFQQYLPLQVGIGETLLEAAESIGLSKKTIRLFIGAYTHSNNYLKALANPKSFRIDLDGNIVEAVEQQHKDKAKLTLRARVKAKKENSAKQGKPSTTSRLTPSPTKPRINEPKKAVNNGFQIITGEQDAMQKLRKDNNAMSKKAEKKPNKTAKAKPKVQVSRSGKNIFTLG